LEEVSIDSLSEYKGRDVTIKGEILSINDIGNLAFLTVAQEKIETVDVILFKDSPLVLEEGDNVVISGSVEEYKGELEIIGNKVIKN